MRPTSTRYTTELERTQARQRTYRESKQRRRELKRLLALNKPICRSTYCLNEAMASGYCGRHDEEMEVAA